MHENDDELEALQRLLDDSYERAGAHLRSIITPERRLTARQVSLALTGMQVIDLATVTADGRPRVAPVDGVFLRGRFHFGSSPDSLRFRHLRDRPWVSAAHTRGEVLGVVVHGRAREVDTTEDTGLRAALLEIYGEGWLEWGAPAAYAVIEPERMFAARFDVTS